MSIFTSRRAHARHARWLDGRRAGSEHLGPPAVVRARLRTAIFVLKMFPRAIKPVDWVTARPVVEKVSVPTKAGAIEVELYRPPSRGPHPGVVATFGINPTGAIDPRVAQMGEALARAGFAALLYWSPAMRDLRLEPADISELVAAYETLIEQPSVDPGRSGFLGICIGGSFALMAAANPAIRDRVRFVFVYAPYSSMRTFAVDIASGTRALGDVREPWEVDPLTWKTYAHVITDWLRPDEAQLLTAAFEDRIAWNDSRTAIVHRPARPVDAGELSDDGRAALRLLRADAGDIDGALRALPPSAQAFLTTMSPMSYVTEIRARRIMLVHDRFDHVIPVGESRRLWSALAGRAGATYAELGMRHLKMPGGASPRRIAREIGRSYLAWYELFREVA